VTDSGVTGTPDASSPLPARVRSTLSESFFIRTTVTRRRSGTPRTVETTYVWDGGRRLIISGYPGKRDWVASMAAHPELTVHTVEGDVWYDIRGRARVLRDPKERLPHLLAFIAHWAKRPGYPRLQIRMILGVLRVHRALRLPWWGPFAMARRTLDRMPCVQIELLGEPVERAGGPPPLSEPQTDRP
jgi:hypothetical protein